MKAYKYVFIFRSDYSEWLLILNHWSLCFSDIIFLWVSSSIESATLFHLLLSHGKCLSKVFKQKLGFMVLSQIFFNCLIYLSIAIFSLSSGGGATAKLLSCMFDSVQPQRRQPTRLFCPWDSPGKNTGVGCHFLL